MPYIDAHLHVVPESELMQAQKGGMASFIMNATQTDDWESVLNLTHRFQGYACLGIHPWYAGQAPEHWEAVLANYLKKDPHIMIGEIGLDKRHPDFEKQLIVFQKALTLAQEYHRAVHIHCVKAWDVISPLLRSLTVPVLLHRFSGTASLVKQLNGERVYFSILAGSPVPDYIPGHKLLVESDAPDGLASPAVLAGCPYLTQAYQNSLCFLTLAIESN